MIIGIGTDIVEIARVEETLFKQADRFTQRLLTDEELSFVPQNRKPSHIAKRWAAKEAISKALGSGIGEFCSFKDICIYKEEGSGKPLVRLSDALLQKLHIPENKAIRVHLSLSDEKAYALAYAVIEQVDNEN